MSDNKKTFLENFRVVSVSSNHNAFGLYGVVILAKSGTAFEIGVGHLFKPKQGDELAVKLTENNNLSEIHGIAYELPRKLSAPPQEVIDEVFKN